MVFGDIRRARVHIRRCQAPSYGNVSDILRTLRTYFEHVCEAGTHVATHLWKAFPIVLGSCVPVSLEANFALHAS